MAGPASAIDKMNLALTPTGVGYAHTLKIAAVAGGAGPAAGTVLSAWDKLDLAFEPDGSGGYTLSTTGGGGGGGSGAAADLTGTTIAANVVNSSLTTVGILANPHMTTPVVDSGGLTVTGNVLILAGSLTVAAGGLGVGGNSSSFTGVATNGGTNLITYTPGAHVSIGSEWHNELHAAQTFSITGSYATERFIRFGIPTITAGSALTVTTAATVAIEGAPAPAGSALITRPLALWLQAGGLGLDGAGGLSTTTGPILQLTGTWITGGTGTTNKPYVLIEPTGTASTAWNTAGTGLGINAATGFTGRLLDLQLSGATVFSVLSTGALSAQSITATGASSTVANLTTRVLAVTPSVVSSGNGVAMTVTGAAHTGQTVAEETDVLFNLSRTVTFTTGAGTVATLRSFRIQPATYAAGTAATTFTQAATFAVTGPPVASTNVVFTNTPVAIWCAGALRLDTNVANGTTAALFTAASAPAAATTAIQEWFVVYNNAGVARYIPAW